MDQKEIESLQEKSKIIKNIMFFFFFLNTIEKKNIGEKMYRELANTTNKSR